MIRILVLGAGAGGGFPQWNCGCDNCQRARSGDMAAPARTQSSLAVSADGLRWVLLNASPDLAAQIKANPVLHPPVGGRGSPIVAAVVTNADVDHIAGLLTLRECHRFAIHATRRVVGVLGANAIFNVVNPAFAPRIAVSLEEPTAIRDADGIATGLSVTAFAVPGKIALWLEDPDAPNFGSVPEDTVGLEISDGECNRFFYLPGCASLPPELAERLRGADLVVFDGTTWTDDEMIRKGFSNKTASRMGHMAMSGEDGTIAAFALLDVKRRVFVHINNTNPVLLADSPERQAAEEAGWDIGFDGMEITL
ncbi:Coenzyme PQQ synthesis protein B [Paramagnetospirillum magnetotacticum MS-1]|uniref:Coenzyme PQQ synthesis protein B n=1 Tax=Paramagnetospirillum magnetotacticum MS-1 TaxID=272627 RepID=A0A0C2YXR3_PARME|nr:pyrroloquinoline quinone biosynthesis protein PqqB [Paramagnetospirillum magnetotacticum]KIL99485.1 Coenzyme PQQ synthesis protein B [Paramagnetospirillum magnetotacticum MS-1]